MGIKKKNSIGSNPKRFSLFFGGEKKKGKTKGKKTPSFPPGARGPRLTRRGPLGPGSAAWGGGGKGATGAPNVGFPQRGPGRLGPPGEREVGKSPQKGFFEFSQIKQFVK